MRKLTWMFTGLLMMCATACSPTSESIIVRGELEGIADSAKVSLMINMGQLMKEVAIANVVDGRFEFEVTLDSLKKENPDLELPAKFSLLGMTAPVVGNQQFYADNGLTEVKGNTGNIYAWRIENKCIDQKQLNAFNDALPAEIIQQRNDVYEEYYLKMYDDMTSEESNRLYDRMDEAGKELYMAQLEVLLATKRLTPVHMVLFRAIVVNGLKYDDYMEPHRDEIERLYARLSPELQASEQGEEIRLILTPPEIVGVGSEIPSDIELFDTKGNSHTLAEFRGKYILMDFWSIGCGPCIMAGPELKELSEKYPEKLVVVSITIDPENLWKKGSEEHDVTWNNFSDYQGRHKGFCSHFGFDGIPYFLIVDPEGVVVKEFMGYYKGALTQNVEEFVK